MERGRAAAGYKGDQRSLAPGPVNGLPAGEAPIAPAGQLRADTPGGGDGAESAYDMPRSRSAGNKPGPAAPPRRACIPAAAIGPTPRIRHIPDADSLGCGGAVHPASARSGGRTAAGRGYRPGGRPDLSPARRAPAGDRAGSSLDDPPATTRPADAARPTPAHLDRGTARPAFPAEDDAGCHSLEL